MRESDKLLMANKARARERVAVDSEPFRRLKDQQHPGIDPICQFDLSGEL